MVKKDNYMWILPSIFILLFLFSAKFCTRRINEEYAVGKAERKDIELFIEIKGEVEAREIIPIGLDIELGVDEIYFQEGDYVKQGDLIIKFSGYQEEQYKKEIDEIRESLAVKSSKLRFEEEKNQLSGDNNIETLQNLRAEIQTLQNALIGKQEKKKLIVRNISSPVNGYIIKINAVKGGTNNASKPVLILAKQTDIKIVTEAVSKERASLLQLGNTVVIKSVNDPEREFEATLYNIKDSDSLNLTVLEFLTKNVENRYLHEILDLKVYYQKRENVLTIPVNALIKTGKVNEEENYYVYTIDKENKVRKRNVETGISNGEIIEIKKGIKENEEVILLPDRKLENNTIVKRKDMEKVETETEEQLRKIKKKNEEYNEEIEKNNRKILKIEREKGIKPIEKKEDTIMPPEKPMTLEEMESMENE